MQIQYYSLLACSALLSAIIQPLALMYCPDPALFQDKKESLTSPSSTEENLLRQNVYDVLVLKFLFHFCVYGRGKFLLYQELYAPLSMMSKEMLAVAVTVCKMKQHETSIEQKEVEVSFLIEKNCYPWRKLILSTVESTKMHQEHRKKYILLSKQKQQSCSYLGRFASFISLKNAVANEHIFKIAEKAK